jgi:hypothetical protein
VGALTVAQAVLISLVLLVTSVTIACVCARRFPRWANRPVVDAEEGVETTASAFAGAGALEWPQVAERLAALRTRRGGVLIKSRVGL